MATLPVRLSFKEEANPEWCVTGHLEQKMVRINSVPLSPWNCSLGHKQWERTCTGLPKYFNISPASFDSQHSLNEGTIFDNWHYPVSCSHRNGYWWIAFATQGCRRQIETEHPLTQTLVVAKTAGRQPGWGHCYLRSSKVCGCSYYNLLPRP